MINTVMDSYILPTLIRYIDRYHWNWNVTKCVINRFYGTDYTIPQLKALYKQVW